MDLPKTQLFGYKKLIVYQKAKALVLDTYQLTGTFPKEEQYILLPQMRRSAISIQANIVEGYAKNSRKEFARFLNISIGSAIELEIYFEMSLDLKYIDLIKYQKISSLLTEVEKLLYSFHKALKKGGIGKE